MAETGFEEIGAYIMRMQNTVAHYIATRQILALCERSDQKPGAWVSRRLWEQEGLNLEGEKERSLAESEVEEARSG